MTSSPKRFWVSLSDVPPVNSFDGHTCYGFRATRQQIEQAECERGGRKHWSGLNADVQAALIFYDRTRENAGKGLGGAGVRGQRFSVTLSPD